MGPHDCALRASWMGCYNLHTKGNHVLHVHGDYVRVRPEDAVGSLEDGGGRVGGNPEGSNKSWLSLMMDSHSKETAREGMLMERVKFQAEERTLALRDLPPKLNRLLHPRNRVRRAASKVG